MNEGAFADNVVAFARILRDAGLPIGAAAPRDALAALALIDLRRRDEVALALQAIFVKRRDHAMVFREAFDLFFQPAREVAGSLAAPDAAIAAESRQISRRVREAFARHMAQSHDGTLRQHRERIGLSLSDQEVLQKKDFAQMSLEEQSAAIAAMRALTVHLAPLASRRLGVDARHARLDLRRTLRAAMRAGGELNGLRFRGPREAFPPIVALLDISGSMSDYSRMFLHFLHALGEHHARMTSFLFGTRLTNVTRAMRLRDPDAAIAACVDHVEDWSGGTRIAPSLRAFNRAWSRRVLGQGAVVLLVTDGLERASDAELAFEMDRLHRSCRRLIWLNPLLRYAQFEPKAKGIQAMLPHVDDFLPVHHLQSLRDLARVLAQAPASRRQAA